jgi:hypothetical protein
MRGNQKPKWAKHEFRIVLDLFNGMRNFHAARKYRLSKNSIAKVKLRWPLFFWDTKRIDMRWHSENHPVMPAPVRRVVTLEDLIEKEARRRCLAAGYPLERRANEDRKFDVNNTQPYWKAYYASQVQQEIERLEQAGFEILPR